MTHKRNILSTMHIELKVFSFEHSRTVRGHFSNPTSLSLHHLTDILPWFYPFMANLGDHVTQEIMDFYIELIVQV